MCLVYSLWKHLSHSHTESHSLFCKCFLDQWTFNHYFHACRLHRRLVLLNICVWMVWSFFHQVMWACVCMITYASFDCSMLSHFCWRIWWPDSPLIVGPSPYHRIDQLQPEQCKGTKLVFLICIAHKQFNQISCFPPRQTYPVVTPGLTLLKNCIYATDLTCSSDWGNCIDKPDRRQVPIPISLWKLCSFPSHSSWQLTNCSS